MCFQTRQEVRKEADYEIVFLSEDTDRLAQIAADDRVLQAYSGAYSGEEYVSDEERFVEVNYKKCFICEYQTSLSDGVGHGGHEGGLRSGCKAE